ACSPAVREHPASAAEVAVAVERAAAAGHTVRVAGAGHSFTDAVLTGGTLLSLERMRRVLDVDAASGLVRVEAGITLRELSEALCSHGLAMENLGDIDVQSIAGATATGTHGTGARLRNLSAALHAVALTLADGSTLEVSEREDPEAWRAARVSIGALGVVTAMTLRVVPAFTLEGVDAAEPLAEVLEGLEERFAAHEHFEFFTFPHSALALTRTNTRVDSEPRPRGPVREWVDDILLRNHAFEAACRLGRLRPALIPALNRTISRAGASSRRVDRSYRVFASPRRVRFTEMEYALPRARAAEAVRAIREAIDARGLAVPFPLEVRAVAPDDALLSPAGGRETAYVAVHMYRGMAWEPYFRAVEAIMDGFDGRPHWGKRHFQTAATLRGRYPDWDRFAAVRARLDPEGRFANAYVERVLGPVTAL
ncbi:MAG: FAD-binding protein, partial [Solirubrobacterales bacterium]|nr:FAD-binding protein [Solirubrobacterales bacterium]